MIALSVFVGGAVAAETTAAQSATVVVAADGSGDYSSIQAAVDAAGDGDRIEVRPGTYSETVDIRKNVTLVAPQGATISNTSATTRNVGIQIYDAAAPEIRGVTITGWRFGVAAVRTTGDWSLQRVTITNTESHGITLDQSTGSWVIQDATIRNTGGYGIDAFQTEGAGQIVNVTISDTDSGGINLRETSGDWTVTDTTVRQVNTDAIEAGVSSGDWLVADTVIRDAGEDAVAAERTPKNWTVRNLTVDGVDDGIDAENATGAWTVTESRFTNIGDNGVEAENTAGPWTIHESRFTNTNDGIVAAGAAVKGNATQNYWGAADGPSGDFPGSGEPAVGNVTVDPFYVDIGLTTLSSAQPTVSPSVSAPNEVVGNPGDQVQVQFTLSNVSGQSGVTLDLTSVPQQLTVNESASTTSGTFESNGQRLVVSSPSGGLTPTIAFDIAQSANSSATFTIEVELLDETDSVTDSVSIEVGDVQQGLDRFDRDGSDTISGREVLEAISAFERGEISGREVLRIISAFEQGTVPSQL